MKILLGQDDIDPNAPGEEDQTPLLQAARNGHGEVVKLLLEHHSVNPNIPDCDGHTPLWWATHYGHAEVMALLQCPTSASRRMV